MIRFFYLLLISLFLFSCIKKETKKEIVNYILIERFIDSTRIGKKGFNKVIIENFKRNDDEDNLVILRFFKKVNIWKDFKIVNKTDWKLTNKYFFEKDGVLGLSPRVIDYNNDGFKDFIYQSGIAARGSNEVNTLFIFNTQENSFYHIKNSDNYPNLFFNKELNCISSFIFTGSTTTCFLSLEKDSLKEFASVDFADSIKVYENKNGKGKKIFTANNSGFEEFTPFKKYKPLEQFTKKELNEINK